MRWPTSKSREERRLGRVALAEKRVRDEMRAGDRPDPDLADAALENAQAGLEVAQTHVKLADRLVGEAREIRKRNHFAERLARAYQGSGSLAGKEEIA